MSRTSEFQSVWPCISRLAMRGGVFGAVLVTCSSLSAQTVPDDANLYYRRTHNGALPPAGVNVSDHSGETTNTIPASALAPARNRPKPLGLLDNGIDPANLGKGDWLWEMPECESSLGLASGDVQGVINYEASQGMQWITVKCGDGTSIWSQFNSDLITQAHNAGLKIFGWAYVYGSNDVSGEISVALNALNLGADGFIIDAEIEYEAAGQKSNAVTYCQGIRASYPTRFLAHAPFPIISDHAAFPYVEFGMNCDAVMPQAYWADIGGTNYAVTMVARLNSEWRNWEAGLAGNAVNAIKPIIPIGQGYNSVNGNVDGTQIAAFIDALTTNTPAATAGGYAGFSFWSCQHHSAAPNKWPAIATATLGTNANTPAYFLSQNLALDLVADTGASVSFGAPAGGTPAPTYQWRVNGAAISGATNVTCTLTNVHATNTGNYSVFITNSSGSATSSVVSLTVYPLQTTVFSDNFESNTSSAWTVNKSSGDSRVTFNYNYANDGIASAPHSTGGTTHGAKLEANVSSGLVAAISMSPAGQSFSGDYRLHFDMWINVNGPLPGGGNGSTESLTAGIGTAGNRVEWTGAGTTADGYWFAVDGEGGVSDTSTTFGDYAAFAGTVLESTGSGVYAAGTGTTARGNGNAYYLAAVPGGLGAPALQQTNYAQQTGVLNAGTPGFAWHDVMVSRRGNVVQWSMDGTQLAAISNATFSASNVFVGYWDPFASLTDNTNLSFGLVDNVRVELPAVAPTISVQPQPAPVKMGSNATFTVTASSLPAPAYQWLLNGNPISGATASNYTRFNIQTNDVGNYSVSVTNIAGATNSSSAPLSIIPPAAAHFQSISAQPDHSLLFTASGDTNATYTIQTSTNLPNWQFYQSVVATNGIFSFNANPATGGPQRYFRVKSGP